MESVGITFLLNICERLFGKKAAFFTYITFENSNDVVTFEQLGLSFHF